MAADFLIMQQTTESRWQLYARLMRVDKPIGTLLLLWPALWALWLAGGGVPDPWILFIFVVGVFLMRSAGCVINDYADRHIDRHVARTRERPLTCGKVSEREALVLFAALSLLAFMLVLTLDRLTILLSLVGVVLAASYPFMKRYTHLPQAYLGIAFGWSVPMAFSAQAGELDPRLWLIFSATVIWAIAYDTMYAMVDREDDLRIGVKSTAILFGRFDRIIIGLLQLLLLANFWLIGMAFGLGVYFYSGLLVAALLSAYHQYLIRERQREACFRAFLNNNWLGAAIFAGILADLAMM